MLDVTAFHEFSAMLITAMSLKPARVSRLPLFLPEDLASPVHLAMQEVHQTFLLLSLTRNLPTLKCVPKSGDFSVFRNVGGVTVLAGGGIEISFEGGSTLHPSLYVCFRCLPLQAGHDANEGLIAVKLWFGFRTELANIMMSKTLWFEVLTGNEKRFKPNKGQVR